MQRIRIARHALGRKASAARVTFRFDVTGSSLVVFSVVVSDISLCYILFGFISCLALNSVFLTNCSRLSDLSVTTTVDLNGFDIW